MRKIFVDSAERVLKSNATDLLDGFKMKVHATSSVEKFDIVSAIRSCFDNLREGGESHLFWASLINELSDSLPSRENFYNQVVSSYDMVFSCIDRPDFYLANHRVSVKESVEYLQRAVKDYITECPNISNKELRLFFKKFLGRNGLYCNSVQRAAFIKFYSNVTFEKLSRKEKAFFKGSKSLYKENGEGVFRSYNLEIPRRNYEGKENKIDLLKHMGHVRHIDPLTMILRYKAVNPLSFIKLEKRKMDGIEKEIYSGLHDQKRMSSVVVEFKEAYNSVKRLSFLSRNSENEKDFFYVLARAEGLALIVSQYKNRPEDIRRNIERVREIASNISLGLMGVESIDAYLVEVLAIIAALSDLDRLPGMFGGAENIAPGLASATEVKKILLKFRMDEAIKSSMCDIGKVGESLVSIGEVTMSEIDELLEQLDKVRSKVEGIKAALPISGAEIFSEKELRQRALEVDKVLHVLELNCQGVKEKKKSLDAKAGKIQALVRGRLLRVKNKSHQDIMVSLKDTKSLSEVLGELLNGQCFSYSVSDVQYFQGPLVFKQWYENIQAIGSLDTPIPIDLQEKLRVFTGANNTSLIEEYKKGKITNHVTGDWAPYAKWTQALRAPENLREYYIKREGKLGAEADKLVEKDFAAAMLLINEVLPQTSQQAIKSKNKQRFTRELKLPIEGSGRIKFDVFDSTQEWEVSGASHFFGDRKFYDKDGECYSDPVRGEFKEGGAGSIIDHKRGKNYRKPFDSRLIGGASVHQYTTHRWAFEGLQGVSSEKEIIFRGGDHTGNISYVLETHGKLIPIIDLSYWIQYQTKVLGVPAGELFNASLMGVLNQSIGNRPYPSGERNIWHDGRHGARQGRLAEIIDKLRQLDVQSPFQKLRFSAQEKLALALAMYFLRSGRVDEKRWDEEGADSMHSVRGYAIYRAHADQFEISSKVHEWIRQFFSMATLPFNKIIDSLTTQIEGSEGHKRKHFEALLFCFDPNHKNYSPKLIYSLHLATLVHDLDFLRAQTVSDKRENESELRSEYEEVFGNDDQFEDLVALAEEFIRKTEERTRDNGYEQYIRLEEAPFILNPKSFLKLADIKVQKSYCLDNPRIYLQHSVIDVQIELCKEDPRVYLKHIAIDVQVELCKEDPCVYLQYAVIDVQMGLCKEDPYVYLQHAEVSVQMQLCGANPLVNLQHAKVGIISKLAEVIPGVYSVLTSKEKRTYLENILLTEPANLKKILVGMDQVGSIYMAKYIGLNMLYKYKDYIESRDSSYRGLRIFGRSSTQAEKIMAVQSVVSVIESHSSGAQELSQALKLSQADLGGLKQGLLGRIVSVCIVCVDEQKETYAYAQSAAFQ